MPARFRAFVSYSHRADQSLAAALQFALQRFAKPYYALRALDVFRDQTDLAANPSLWRSIESALSASDFLILMASPRAAASSWVKREIDHWLSRHDGSMASILFVLTDGELGWHKGDIDWTVTTALPRRLDWDDAPEIHTLDGRFTEQPLFVDLRWARDTDDLSLRNPAFLDCVATLAAALHGKPKRDIIGIDIAEHRRFRRVRRTAIAGLVALTILAVGLGGIAERQRETAVAERNLAEARQRAAAAEARMLGPASEAGETLGFAVESVAIAPTYEGSVILQRALHHLARRVEPEACGHPARLVAISRDQVTLAAVGDDHVVRVCRATGEVVDAAPEREPIELLALDAHGHRILAATRTTSAVQAITRDLDRRTIQRAVLPALVEEIELSDDGQRLLTTMHRYNRQAWTADGQRVALPNRSDGDYVFDIAVSPDGRFIASTASNLAPALHVQDEHGARVTTADCPGNTIAFSPSGTYLACSTPSEITVLRTSNWSTAFRDRIAGSSSKPAVLFTPDSNQLVVFTGDELYIWETGRFRELTRHALSSQDFIGAALTPDVERLVVLEPEGIRVFALPDLLELARAPHLSLSIHQGLAFLPEGHEVVVPVTEDHGQGAAAVSAMVRSAAYAVAPQDEVTRWWLGHSGPVRGLAFSPTGRWLATTQEHGEVSLLPARGGRPMVTRAAGSDRDHDPAISASRAARFSPDERFLAVPFDDLVLEANEYRLRRGNIEIWALDRVEDPRVVARLPGPYDDVFFDDADRLHAVRRLERTQGGTKAHAAQIDLFTPPFHAEAVVRIAHLPSTAVEQIDDDALLDLAVFRTHGRIVAGGHSFALSSLPIGALPADLWQAPRYVPRAFTLSEDGDLLAVGNEPRGVVWWDFSRAERHPLVSSARAYAGFAFDPDHQVLAADTDDATTIWSLGQSAETIRIARADRQGSAVAFSPDGVLLVRGEGSAVVGRLWRAEDLLDSACQVLLSSASGLWRAKAGRRACQQRLARGR
jgi:WD40 repeat protein